jgi:hypothetical protein
MTNFVPILFDSPSTKSNLRLSGAQAISSQIKLNQAKKPYGPALTRTEPLRELTAAFACVWAEAAVSNGKTVLWPTGRVGGQAMNGRIRQL